MMQSSHEKFKNNAYAKIFFLGGGGGGGANKEHYGQFENTELGNKFEG